MDPSLKQRLSAWYQRSAPMAVLAELAEARDYATRPTIRKSRALRRWLQCELRIRRLLSPFFEDPESVLSMERELVAAANAESRRAADDLANACATKGEV